MMVVALSLTAHRVISSSLRKCLSRGWKPPDRSADDTLAYNDADTHKISEVVGAAAWPQSAALSQSRSL
jgi:hypothetical protein